ncbi:hypothetical protein JTB14_027115 [Gonioctena quinquepunctata]|nr:hypothetical protein JTB14_027115 [Gonioctena quinquepunctata]
MDKLSEADRQLLRDIEKREKERSERIEARRLKMERQKDRGEGSKKGGEAGSVPRTYSMGAQPPFLSQPLDEWSQIDDIRKALPMLNDDMHHVIDEYSSHLWARVTNDDNCRTRGKNPPLCPNIPVNRDYYLKFCTMKANHQVDDFEELIGTTFSSREYEYLKYTEVRKKHENYGAREGENVSNIHNKEHGYRLDTFSAAVRWVVDVIQCEQSEISQEDGKYKNDINYIIEKLKKYDPKSYQLFEKNRREREERLRELAIFANQPSEYKHSKGNKFSQKEYDDMLANMRHIVDGMKFSHIMGENYNKPLYQRVKEAMKTIDPEDWEKLNEAEYIYVNELESSSESFCGKNDDVHELENAESNKGKEDSNNSKTETQERREIPSKSVGINEEQELKGVKKDIERTSTPPSPTNTTPGKYQIYERNHELSLDEPEAPIKKDEEKPEEPELSHLSKTEPMDIPTPLEGINIGIEYEEDYFTHLSNPESNDELEESSENFQKAEEVLKLIAQQKNSLELNYKETVENLSTTTMEGRKAIDTHLDNNKSKAKNKNVYTKFITQTDGPSDVDNLLSTSSEEEDLSSLSMRKKNTQFLRNIKRRKTEKLTRRLS